MKSKNNVFAGASLGAAVLLFAACGELGHTGLTDPEFAKGKPDLTVEVMCEITPGNEFSDRLLALCQATDNRELYSSRRADQDRRGLISKLNRAETKCEVDGDAAGAISKLTDYRNKIASLIAEGKIDKDAGAELGAEADALIADLENGVLICSAD